MLFVEFPRQPGSMIVTNSSSRIKNSLKHSSRIASCGRSSPTRIRQAHFEMSNTRDTYTRSWTNFSPMRVERSRAGTLRILIYSSRILLIDMSQIICNERHSLPKHEPSMKQGESYIRYFFESGYTSIDMHGRSRTGMQDGTRSAMLSGSEQG